MMVLGLRLFLAIEAKDGCVVDEAVNGDESPGLRGKDALPLREVSVRG